MTDEAVIELTPQLGVRGACDAVGCAQAGFTAGTGKACHRNRKRLSRNETESSRGR